MKPLYENTKTSTPDSLGAATGSAWGLFEALSAHEEVWGCHFGLLRENGKYEATCLVGEADAPDTKFADYCEPQESPMAAVKLAMKNAAAELQELIRDKRHDSDQRRNCRLLRRAILETLRSSVPVRC